MNLIDELFVTSIVSGILGFCAGISYILYYYRFNKVKNAEHNTQDLHTLLAHIDKFDYLSSEDCICTVALNKEEKKNLLEHLNNKLINQLQKIPSFHQNS